MQKTLNCLVKLGLVGILSLLVACSTTAPQLTTAQKEARALQRLQQEDVTTVELGQERRLIIPSNLLFVDQTLTLKHDATLLLAQITQLLTLHPTVKVQVTGYTDDAGSRKRNWALAREQAEIVMAYLGAHKIDARIIHATSQGPKQPIAAQKGRHAHWNKRIEISYRIVSHYGASNSTNS